MSFSTFNKQRIASLTGNSATAEEFDREIKWDEKKGTGENI